MSGEWQKDHIQQEDIPYKGNPGQQEEEEQYKGPLKYAGDPLGKGLGTVLSPVGKGVSTVLSPVTKGVGNITKPALGPITGEKDEKAEVVGGNNKDSYEHGKQSLGKREQTGDNPLGLDQSGKWGFRDESNPFG